MSSGPLMRTARAHTSWQARARPFTGEFAAVKPVAKNPEALACFILDAEIIPRQRFAVLLPPFHRDAFGALDAGHHMGGAAPGEVMRRPVRHHRKRHLDGFRFFEQPQRAPRRLALHTRQPSGWRG